MKLDHIFCDMDGVLCDFFSASLALFDFDPTRYPAGEWDIPKVLGITNEEFWRKIEAQPTFWLDLKPYPWAEELVALLDKSRVPWTIATSPSRDPKCLAQKAEWLHRNISPHFTRYMMGAEKHLLAAPGRLLIDDADHNVSAFLKHGGRCVQIPQRWNAFNPSAGFQWEITRDVLNWILQ